MQYARSSDTIIELQSFPTVKKLYFLFVLTLSTIFVYGQEGLPLEQQLLLARYDMEWTAPESPYRVNKRPYNAFQEFDFGLYLRKEKVEIRYLFIPFEDDSKRELIPHLRAPRMAMHLASNDEDSHIAAHEVDPAVLDSVYQADWGQVFYFPPKKGFSEAKDCQMMALYREEIGMCFVFLLFEEAPPSLPDLAELLRFLPRRLQN